MVGALAVVNAIGSAVIGDGPHFWAGLIESGSEFGGLGAPPDVAASAPPLRWKGGPQWGTTIALVATDAALSKAMAKRLALAAHGGIAKALSLSHALSDGDAVFAAATGRRPLGDERSDIVEIGAAAANCLARAVARGVFEARTLPYPGALPSWQDRFGPGPGRR
jgi:L-aminopeptidase/D-esterase-like protein